YRVGPIATDSDRRPRAHRADEDARSVPPRPDARRRHRGVDGTGRARAHRGARRHDAVLRRRRGTVADALAHGRDRPEHERVLAHAALDLDPAIGLPLTERELMRHDAGPRSELPLKL